ncbi:MAG: magnesium chelatase domain-containing protein, partial [Fervidobacterium sp.]
MFFRTKSAVIVGITPVQVTVEVDINTRSVHRDINIVGLPDTAVKESKQRIISALKNSGNLLPNGLITVNLAPGDIKKEGTFLDLAIALGILGAANIVKPFDSLVLGELGLDGSIRKVRGVLPILLEFQNEIESFIIPAENYTEAAATRAKFLSFSTLNEAILLLNQEHSVTHQIQGKIVPDESNQHEVDFSEIKG